MRYIQLQGVHTHKSGYDGAPILDTTSRKEIFDKVILMFEEGTFKKEELKGHRNDIEVDFV